MYKLALEYLLLQTTNTISKCNKNVVDYVLAQDIARNSENIDTSEHPFHDFEELCDDYMTNQITYRYLGSFGGGSIGVAEIIGSSFTFGTFLVGSAIGIGVASYYANKK